MPALADEMNTIDWNSILLQNHDVNTIFGSFYSNISQVIDKHVPLKNMTKNEIKFKTLDCFRFEGFHSEKI